ncbi:MAG: FumA C-terminus/TtdB family hydratase beta subunit, partial [Desulfobacterales bacterium]|nr:FumA C-terminus/TtdB family hydratase beta subunit [Desulfobacterales bacterium]
DMPVLQIAPEGLIHLAEEAFKDVSHLFRTSHLELLKKILDDPESSANDKYVALDLLKNAVISADGEFPMCQDTGTAIIIGKKGQQVWTGFSDEKTIAEGVFNAYKKYNLRYSQLAPITLFEEKNTGNNLPAQIELYPADGDEYHFLFIAKGGGSANKTRLFQETKATLTPDKLTDFVKDKMKAIGTSGCPPYHLSVVIGGTSAEVNLKTVKLSTAKYLDNLPSKGSEKAHAFRDLNFEAKLLDISRELGIGAQFGGKYYCLDVRVIRLPRHGASMPIGIGVSCSADRQMKAKITRKGIFLEKLEFDPSRFLPTDYVIDESAVRIDLDRSMDDICATLSKYPVATRLMLTGKIVVARDIAHSKLQERLDRGEDLPGYFKDHIIYYAGPAKTPKGYPSGSFGPTTAQRMDSYVPGFQEKGGSLVMLAKGNRSKTVTQSCKKFGGFYLGSIGGSAARLGKECITNIETIEYPELGMEAIFRISVKDFPAFIIVDDKGNDFFEGLMY